MLHGIGGPVMGERLKRLRVEAFRGVPTRWEIEWPRGASMVVRGDNGTGKSTIADALEWYFKGRIEFLAREGRDRSVRHVGASKGIVTSVSVETTGSLGGRQAMPNARSSPWIPARVRDGFVLRGRTLSDFVEQPKAKKWVTLADILGLDAVDRLRLDLQTVRNQLDDERSQRTQEVKRSATALRPALKTVSDDGLLSAIRDECSAAGLAPPSDLNKALDPEWSAVAQASEATARAVGVSTLLADVQAAAQTQPSLQGIDEWNAHVATTDRNASDRFRFMFAADAVLHSQPDDGRCPLCGKLADWADISARVAATLDELRSAATEHEEAQRQLQRVVNAIADYERLLEGLRRRLPAASISPIDNLPASITEAVSASLNSSARLNRDDVEAYLALAKVWLAVLEAALGALPPPPSRESGLVRLGTICEQGRRWRAAVDGSRVAQAAFELADRLHVTYQQVEAARYRAILSSISSRVAQLYSTLHPGEGFAGVAIEPWTDKGVELTVDFHGTHQKPPHGVLSESHLNSLAVALFLAMAEMFNERLDFVVLDDVVNSFEVEHRGRLAELLVTEFNDKQLIVLTHDHQFFQHLMRRARSWTSVEFGSWTFDEGPRTTKYSSARILDAAREALRDGDVQGGGAKARRALEEILDESCEALEAPLPFRRGHANDRRELAELMSGLRSRLKSSAKEWYGRLDPLLTNLDADVQAALNAEVHAGDGWASIQEVEAALQRVEMLEAAFTCPACGSRIWAKGTKDAARCGCGASAYPPSLPNGG